MRRRISVMVRQARRVSAPARYTAVSLLWCLPGERHATASMPLVRTGSARCCDRLVDALAGGYGHVEVTRYRLGEIPVPPADEQGPVRVECERADHRQGPEVLAARVADEPSITPDRGPRPPDRVVAVE